MPLVAVREWQSSLLLPCCSSSVAYSGGRIAWREKCRPFSSAIGAKELEDIFPHQLLTHNDAVSLARSPEHTVNWQRRTSIKKTQTATKQHQKQHTKAITMQVPPMWIRKRGGSARFFFAQRDPNFPPKRNCNLRFGGAAKKMHV